MMGIYIAFVTLLAIATAFSPNEWKEMLERIEE